MGKEICFYHVFFQDCKCTEDEHNKHCPGYVRFMLRTFEAKSQVQETSASE